LRVKIEIEIQIEIEPGLESRNPERGRVDRIPISTPISISISISTVAWL